jgi:hypothetical protein
VRVSSFFVKSCLLGNFLVNLDKKTTYFLTSVFDNAVNVSSNYVQIISNPIKRVFKIYDVVC